MKYILEIDMDNPPSRQGKVLAGSSLNYCQALFSGALQAYAKMDKVRAYIMAQISTAKYTILECNTVI